MNVVPFSQPQRDVPPSDVDTEKAALGAILTDPELAQAADVRRALLELTNDGLVRAEGSTRDRKHVWIGGQK